MSDIILETALKALTREFDAFIAECNEGGKPKAPSIGALMRAKGCLPKTYSQAFKKTG